MQHLGEFIAGLGIFLFAMFLLEDSLKNLAGRSFKLFLKKHTSNKLEAIGSGAIVTGILQSSSVVILMILAFVGAGAMSMRNALAVVIGSNFGSTLDSWIVATLGFKYDIADFAMPVIGVTGILAVIFSDRKRVFEFSRFFLGFGFLFLGLSFMKESIEALVADFDFTPYEGYHRSIFVLIGFVITALIQSSSATVAITLSALSTGVIPFDFAVAVVIGSEFGTSVKIVLGSIGGISAKRRIAVGNLIFNFVITTIAYFAMYPLIRLIVDVIGIKDPLIGLVMFQSSMNLIGVAIFIPFLNKFSDFLEKRFSSENDSTTFYIRDVSPDVQAPALIAMEKEVSVFIHRIIPLNLDAFDVKEIIVHTENDLQVKIDERNKKLKSYSERYDDLKHTEGEILAFYLKMRKKQDNQTGIDHLDQLVSAVRNAIYSAKAMKDVQHNRKEFHDSANDAKYAHYKLFQKEVEDFYREVDEIFKTVDEETRFDKLKSLLETARNDYDGRMNYVYKEAEQDKLNETDISSLLNTNREIYASSKAIVLSMKDYLLSKKYADKFGDVLVI